MTGTQAPAGRPAGPDGRHGRARRRRRWVALGVGAVAVAVVAGLGIRLVAGGGSVGSSIADLLPSPEPPLLDNAPVLTVPAPAPPARVTGVGFDVSYPQCGSTLPRAATFAIVGVNGGAPLTSNRCFSRQIAWARGRGTYAVYINTANPGVTDPVAYGRRLAEDAIRRERASGVSGIAVWWLDVEVTNHWEGSAQENATVLDAMAVRLQQAGVRVGIYSSPQQWEEIAGSWEPGLPVWNATGPGTQASAEQACPETVAGSATAIVQWVQKAGSRLLDHNVVCPAWQHRAGDLFDVSRRR